MIAAGNAERVPFALPLVIPEPASPVSGILQGARLVFEKIPDNAFGVSGMTMWTLLRPAGSYCKVRELII